MTKRRNLTRHDIAQELQKETGSLLEAYQFVGTFFDTLSEGIINSEKVKIHKFGVFRCISKKERIGRNPRTGETAEITPRRVVSFIASKNFKTFLTDLHDAKRESE
ncbi:MAG: HU family DNA-binding protein [Gammaproteobacteria bacterium]